MKKTGSLSFGGEFRDPAREAEFRADRLPESARQARLAFQYAFLLNLLFYLSDWRFYGQPHFTVALPARTVIVLASLACFLAVRRVRTVRSLAAVCAAWGCTVIPACAALVSPHTDVALFITFTLPLIFYLVLPTSFLPSLALGAGCGAATLAAYMSSAPRSETSLGLVFGMATLNVILALVLNRSNRLQRLAWAATRAEQATNGKLSEHRRMLKGILKAVPAPLVILDRASGRLVRANGAARGYFGRDALRDPGAVRGLLDREEYDALVAGLKPDGEVAELETRLSLPDGTVRDVLLIATLAVLGKAEAVLAVIVDITGRKRMEERLTVLASSDQLTGLANRFRFFDLAAAEVGRAQRYRRPLAVVMLDIDFFKRINDCYGHQAGDLALRAFASLCRTLVRTQDTMARVGGEEFALLLPETGRAEAEAMAERLRAAVEGLRLEGVDSTMTVSVGVSEVLAEETEIYPALSRADQALYAAKRAGRNRVVHHDCAA